MDTPQKAVNKNGAKPKPKRSISNDSVEMSRRVNNAWNVYKRSNLGSALTQKNAADQIGVSQPMFNQMLSGAVAINPMMVLSVAALLRCDLGALVAGLEEYKLLNAVSPVMSTEIPVTLTLSGKPVKTRVVRIMAHTMSGAFAVEIDTDEYAPRYSNGEYAIIDPLTKWEVGNQVLIRYGKGPCIIRVVSSIDGANVITHHPTQVGVNTEVNLSDETITVCGLIRGVQFK